eukprot:8570985-Pyramimonas_sp.AAC.1
MSFTKEKSAGALRCLNVLSARWILLLKEMASTNWGVTKGVLGTDGGRGKSESMVLLVSLQKSW